MVPSSTATTGVCRGARMSIASCPRDPPPRRCAKWPFQSSTSTSTSSSSTGSRRSCRRRTAIGSAPIVSASDRRLDHARRVGRQGPGRLAGRFVDVGRWLRRGRGRFTGCAFADRRANPPARRHAGVEAGDERGNHTPAAASLRAHLKITGVPGATSAASRAASQLVRRTQPCDCVCPTFEGSGVPWMP